MNDNSLPTRRFPDGVAAALRIVVIYVIIGGLWIVFSDHLVSAVSNDADTLTKLQTYKGWFYVLATAGLLYGLIYRSVVAIHKSREEIHEQKELFRRRYSAISVGVVVKDLNGRVMNANPAASKMLGLPQEQLINKTSREVFGKTIDEDGNPMASEEHPSSIAIRTGEPIRDVVMGLFADRPETTRWMLVNAEPVRDPETDNFVEVLMTFVDITKRRKIEEALRASEENFRSLFDHAPAAIFGFDKDMVVVQVNEATERLYGYSTEEMVGRSMFDTFAQTANYTMTREIVDRVFAGETVENLEWNDCHADGSPVYVLTNATPVFDAGGKVIMGLSLNMDITERKQQEQSKLELESHKKDFYRRTILAATEGKLVICDPDEIEATAGPAIASWDFTTARELHILRVAAEGIAKEAGMVRSRIDDLILCIGEATTNALKHAGGGTMSIHKVAGGLLVEVTDHGHGIEALKLPDATLKKGYSTAGSLGMGYKAIISIADRVYLSTGPMGTTVAIEMKLRPQEETLFAGINLPDTWDAYG